MKHSIAFKNYARSYTVEVLKFQEPISQLRITKSHIKTLLKDLLNEIRGFNYQTLEKLFVKK